MDESSRASVKASAPRPHPEQSLGCSLPDRVDPKAVDCPICGEPLKRWGSELICDAALKSLASGWKE
jgi:hypothetical protein